CLTLCFFFNGTAPPELSTLSLHDALPILGGAARRAWPSGRPPAAFGERAPARLVRTSLRDRVPAAAPAAGGGTRGEGLHGPPQAGALRRRARGLSQARQGIGGARRDAGWSRRPGGGALAQHGVGRVPAQRGVRVQRRAHGEFRTRGGRDRL